MHTGPDRRVDLTFEKFQFRLKQKDKSRRQYPSTRVENSLLIYWFFLYVT